MQTGLTEQELKNEIRRLAPFFHRIELPYGLSTHIPELSRRNLEDTRVDTLVKHAFPSLLSVCEGSLAGKRVLDVACNCGGFSVEAARLGAEYVLGIDIVDHYLEQANLIKQALRLQQVEFKKIDITNLDTSNIGQFDITFCFGILYHLENPILVMKQLASVTQHIMLLDTNILRLPFNRKPMWLMDMPAIATPEATDVTTSLWRSKDKVVQFRPTEKAVIELLKFLGFSKVQKLNPKSKGLEKRYYNGTRATFLAIRS